MHAVIAFILVCISPYLATHAHANENPPLQQDQEQLQLDQALWDELFQLEETRLGLLEKNGSNFKSEYDKASAQYSRLELTRKNIEMLLEIVPGQKNANPNSVCSKTNKTVLMRATEIGDKKVLDLLLKAGTDTNLTDLKGRTAIFYAIRPDSPYRDDPKLIIESLIANGADLNQQDKEGKTPLMVAVERAKIDESFLQLLLTRGAKIDLKDTEKRNAITWLVYSTIESDYRHLVSEEKGEPWKKEAYFPQLRKLRLLLNFGSHENETILNLADSSDKTPLKLAIESDYIEFTQALLNAGAYPDVHTLISMIVSKNKNMLLLFMGEDFFKASDEQFFHLIAARAKTNIAIHDGLYFYFIGLAPNAEEIMPIISGLADVITAAFKDLCKASNN